MGGNTETVCSRLKENHPETAIRGDPLNIQLTNPDTIVDAKKF